MSFRTDIANLKKVDRFVGGSKSQREHLNALVDNQGAMIDSANRNADPSENDGALLVSVLNGGIAIDIVLSSYLVAT